MIEIVGYILAASGVVTTLVALAEKDGSGNQHSMMLVSVVMVLMAIWAKL